MPKTLCSNPYLNPPLIRLPEDTLQKLLYIRVSYFIWLTYSISFVNKLCANIKTFVDRKLSIVKPGSHISQFTGEENLYESTKHFTRQ